MRFAKVRGFCSLARVGPSEGIRCYAGFRATETIENNKVELDKTFRGVHRLRIGTDLQFLLSNGRRFRPWRPGRSGFDPGE
jgi:hypothetical protein